MTSQPSEAPTYSRAQLLRYGLRLLAGFLVVFACVAYAARHFRDELEGLGRAFVEHLGYLGMGLGTMLADGLHFPVPPQAYMLLAVSSEASLVLAFLAISVGSLLGGGIAYFLGGRLARWRWLSSRLEPLSHMIERSWARFGYRSLLFASLSPIPYATVCSLVGMNRLPPRAYGFLALFRIPRLAVFLGLIYAGWRI